jgi:Zn-dependent M16 (insulinase) family peptidase
MRQPAYSIGMKGVDAPNLGAVEEVIFQTLEKLVKEGIVGGDIDAALNTFEFDLRENNHGSYPQGLSVMLTMLETWLYDWDPLVLVAYETPLAGLKQALADNPRYLEELIEINLLSNPHRTTVRLIPDSFKAEREDAEDAALMQAVKDSMIPDEIERTITAAKRLLDMQKAPDSPASIKTLPLLQRSDLNPKIRTIPREIESFDNATVLFHNLFTGGIAYIDIGFDLHGLNAEDLPWVSLLGSMLLEMGTQEEDFASLSQRIAQKTGGLYATPVHAAPEGSDQSVSRLFLRGKCMTAQINDLFDILNDILFRPAFNQPKRFKEILLEQKAEMESGLVPSGHSAVLSRLKAHYHESARAAEAMGGVDALFFHREVEKMPAEEWPTIVTRIEGILQKLLVGGLVINVTADAKDRASIFQTLEKFIPKFPMSEQKDSSLWNFSEALPASEALLAPSRVNYVGAAINLFDKGYVYDGSALVITKYLRTAWLWEKVRVQGGAYGAVCSFDPNCGSFAFASYRDPNLADTLETYAQTGEFLKELVLDEDELSRALIGAIGGIDAYLLPDAKGYSDTLRWLTGYTDEKRQQRRNEVLATTADHFRRFGDFLTMDDAAISVLGSKDTVQESGVPFAQTLKVL